MGAYFVTPTSRLTHNGRYQPCFAIQRNKHRSNYCRVYRFDTTFTSSEAAKLYAVTQGWLQAQV